LIETQVGDLNLASDILGKIKKDLTTLAHKCGTHDIYRLLLILYQIFKESTELMSTLARDSCYILNSRQNQL